MKKIKFIIPVLISFSLFSCSDYLDIDQNPNNALRSQVSPELALSAAESSSYAEQARQMNRLGNFFMNNWGMNVNSFAATNPEEYSFNFDNTFYETIWDNTFLRTANYSNIINTTDSGYENYKAIAMIMKSFHFQYMVDLYGDIPYFDAHKGAAVVYPKYDSGKVVYRDLIVQLDKAISLIHSNPAAKTVGNIDVILGGDMVKWEKFANTLKLRILLRQTKLTDSETTTYLANEFAKFSAPSFGGFVDFDVTINPGYGNGNASKQNPFYGLMFNADDTSATTYNFVRASKYLGDQLNATADPRAGKLFELTAGQVVGVLQGDLAIVNGGTAPVAISGLAKGAGTILSGSAQNGYIMTKAEALLLQAEAVKRGFVAGNDQTLFDDAIIASMNMLGVASGAASTYVASINTVPGKGYAVGTSDQKLAAIMYQKNIALQAGANAIESFIEYTRTGLIDTIPLTINGGTSRLNKPRRLLYPTSELVGNSANVPTVSLNSIFSKGAFWLP